MPAKKTTKTEKKSPAKEKEEIIDAEVVEEEKPIETKIVKVMPDSTELMTLADTFAKSGMFPAITNKFEAAVVIEYGRELGIKPVISLQTISVIKGRLSIESKALYALALEKGVKIKIVRKDDKGCTLEFSKKGREPHTTSFTSEDAKRAGLHTKDSYTKYPEEMYFNRCISKGLRAFDPGIFLGVYTPEEMEDFSASPLTKPAIKEETEKPEEEKPKATIAFTKGKEQVATCDEPEKEEKPAEIAEETPEEADDKIEKDLIVKEIKACLEEAKVDAKLFKKWLGDELGPSKPDRDFVGEKFGNWSLTEGKLEDLKLLKENIEWAMNEYLESDTFKEEAQKEEPDEKKKEDPL